jgi:spore coat protein A
MHTHLVTFQVIGRTPFDAAAYEEAYEPAGGGGVPGGIDPTPFATGPMLPPDPSERGFKDTVKANPGYFTTVRAKYVSAITVFSSHLITRIPQGGSA